jgi:hypothetical protein
MELSWNCICKLEKKGEGKWKSIPSPGVYTRSYSKRHLKMSSVQRAGSLCYDTNSPQYLLVSFIQFISQAKSSVA